MLLNWLVIVHLVFLNPFTHLFPIIVYLTYSQLKYFPFTPNYVTSDLLPTKLNPIYMAEFEIFTIFTFIVFSYV